MRGYPEFQIETEHVLELILKAPDAVLGRIYRVRNRAYRQVGFVAAYKERADAETFCDHWRAECYVSPKSYSSSMLDGLGAQLLASTKCSQPMMLNVCFGQRTDGRFKTYGKVYQEDG
jgi:hypothetical protein